LFSRNPATLEYNLKLSKLLSFLKYICDCEVIDCLLLVENLEIVLNFWSRLWTGKTSLLKNVYTKAVYVTNLQLQAVHNLKDFMRRYKTILDTFVY